jgi:hypothetical protein
MAVVRALGHELSPAAAIATVPVIALCVSLPFSVQGIGVRETAYVYVLGRAGVPEEIALSAAVLSFVLTVALSAAGGLAVAAREAERARRPSCGAIPSRHGDAPPAAAPADVR